MKVVSLCLIWATLAATPGASATRSDRDAERFVAHLESLVPVLLDATGVAGAAVGLVRDGEVVWLGGFGLADRERARPVAPTTVFNVGSISKTVTALGVMRLVERGVIELDEPLSRILPEWRGPSKDERITVRMLLSHTGGVSLPAVPELPPGDPPPSLGQAIADDLSLIATPGERYSYSGGGYMLLQLLVEEKAGPFEEFMERELFRPLDMSDSGYRWSPRQIHAAATPYDDGAPTERFLYVGQAAASLNSTAGDLARLLASTLDGGSRGPRAPLDDATLELMRTPAPNSEQQYGLRYGLGFDLWPLADDDWLAGHNGQNTGWSATFWSRPSTGDGIVVLTNDSDGRDLWKWLHCDWVYWLTGITWRGYCTGRPEGLIGPPDPV